MRIAVFLHGTTIMHSGGAARTREERVEQVRSGEASVSDFAASIPPEERARIASVVVREFEGIDHLADDPALLSGA